MRFVRVLALVSAIAASLSGVCKDDGPTGIADSDSIPGSYILTVERSSTTGTCPPPIASPRTVAAALNAQGEITLPLFIGVGTFSDSVDEVDEEGVWEDFQEVTLTNGFRVRQHMYLEWTLNRGRVEAEGDLTIEHRAPDGTLVCTEVYDVVLVAVGS